MFSFSYRQLLDQWQLYHTRAHFDIAYKRQLVSLLSQPSSYGTTSAGGLVSAHTPSSASTTATATTSTSISTPIPTSSCNVPPQIFVRCNFCNHTIPQHSSLSHHSTATPSSSSSSSSSSSFTSSFSTSAIPNQRRGLGSTSSTSAGSGSSTSCPTCRKPLPRCAICLLHLGSPVENMQFFGLHSADDERKSIISFLLVY